MRRVPAILLVILFSFSLIGPALLVDAESNLPACCRRDGQHHCRLMGRLMGGPMGRETAPASGAAADAPHVHCPFFPSGGALVPDGRAVLPAASRSARVSIVRYAAIPCHAQGEYRISLERAHGKRGPPSLLS